MPRKRAIGPDTALVNLRPELDEPTVKSADRVIRIFEFFDQVQTGATVIDVADALGIPQSSASVLLRSLMTLGYLSYEPEQRTYLPSRRVALLGSWVDRLVVTEGPMIRVMHRIAEATRSMVFLATRNRLNVQVIHIVNGPDSDRFVAKGSGHALILSCTGHALLSRLGDDEITRIATATNARLPEGVEPVARADLMARIAEVRHRGYALGSGARFTDYSSLVLPIAGGGDGPISAGDPLAIGIGGSPSEILPRYEQIAEMVRRELSGIDASPGDGLVTDPPS